MEDKDGGLDTTLTDLLEDVDLEKLEEIMEELLPLEGVKQAAAALAMSTGQGSKVLSEKNYTTVELNISVRIHFGENLRVPAERP